MPISRSKIQRSIVEWMNNHCPVLLTKMRFRKYFHRKMNLKDPQDINEKISWLELFTDTTEWARCSDKYAVRGFVKERGLESILNDLYGKWDKAEDIDWNTLPNQFILKTNNGSGTVKVVKDKTNADTKKIIKELNSWLTIDCSSSTTEYHYRQITPCIIAERLLFSTPDEQKISSTLMDYKIWCFNGKPYCCWVCCNRVGNHTDVMTYDLEWNAHPEWSIFNEHYRQGQILPRPKNFEQMIDTAQILSASFPVVRVDLYNIDGKIYFGELTFTSLGGTMNFYTDDFLLKMGQQIDLTGVEIIKNNDYRKRQILHT